MISEGVPCLKGCRANYCLELMQSSQKDVCFFLFFFFKIMIMGLLVRILWALSGLSESSLPWSLERRLGIALQAMQLMMAKDNKPP